MQGSGTPAVGSTPPHGGSVRLCLVQQREPRSWGGPCLGCGSDPPCPQLCDLGQGPPGLGFHICEVGMVIRRISLRVPGRAALQFSLRGQLGLFSKGALSVPSEREVRTVISGCCFVLQSSEIPGLLWHWGLHSSSAQDPFLAWQSPDQTPRASHRPLSGCPAGGRRLEALGPDLPLPHISTQGTSLPKTPRSWSQPAPRRIPLPRSRALLSSSCPGPLGEAPPPQPLAYCLRHSGLVV